MEEVALYLTDRLEKLNEDQTSLLSRIADIKREIDNLDRLLGNKCQDSSQFFEASTLHFQKQADENRHREEFKISRDDKYKEVESLEEELLLVEEEKTRVITLLKGLEKDNFKCVSNEIINELEFCKSIVLSDPRRCYSELTRVLDKM